MAVSEADDGRSYTKAIEMLHAFDYVQSEQTKNLPRMTLLLKSLGISMQDIDNLNCVHVTGTKGKGSTCSFIESIFLQSGLSTGMYTSPHLCEYRERIRLHGQPISHEKFAKYFFECYDRLLAKNMGEADNDLLSPFAFITAMMFYVFVKEKVDVAIVEVGVGGAFDCTNIIRNPVVSALAGIEIDHVHTLGSKVEQIAWHKSGIIKATHPAVTIRQKPEAMEMIVDKAEAVNSPLLIAQPLSKKQGESNLVLGLPGAHQWINASLAVQTCKVWFEEKSHDEQFVKSKKFDALYNGVDASASVSSIRMQLADNYKRGLAKASLAGRCQEVSKEGLTMYVDGAHTPQSISYFVEWAQNKISDIEDSKHTKVLFFNVTGTRDTIMLIKPLLALHFDLVVFCPNVVNKQESIRLNGESIKVTHDGSYACDRSNLTYEWAKHNQDMWQNAEKVGFPDRTPTPTAVFESVSSAFTWILERSPVKQVGIHPMPKKVMESNHVHLFVTGSIALVGCVVSCIGGAQST